MYEEAEYDLSKEGLAKALAEVLSDTVVIHYLAHGYHWNVKGPEFVQFHDFFATLYEDAAENEDPIAENIRKLGFDAPHMLGDFLAITSIEARPCYGDPIEMSANLYQAYTTYLGCLNNAFTVANAINSQGIADYLAGRIDVTEKWIWQLGTTIGADATVVTESLGKSNAEVPVIAMHEGEHPVIVELQPTEETVRQALQAAGHLIPEEQDFADAIREIVREHGKFNADNTGVWVGYTPTSENVDNAKIGVKCGNCVFFSAPNGCQIIDVPVEDGGLCRLAVLPDGAVTATAGSKPAPKKDQIKGSDRNKEGSAGSGRSVKFSKQVEDSLKEKVDTHNKSVEADSKKVTLSMLKAVYRRGAGAFSTSHRPDQNRNSWAMARVNAFLKLVKSGSPSNAKYTTDNDLLPSGHPKSTRASGALTATGYADRELYIELRPESDYESPEDALFAMAEFSGLGYDSIPLFRAAWRRGVANNESPFSRAADLAIDLYDSRDADLLPKQESEI